MSHLRKLAALAAVAVLALSLAAVAGAASGPRITSLRAHQSGKKVTVTVRTAGFRIDAKDVGGKPKAGRGHEHFRMDRGKYDFPKYSGANGRLAVKLGVQGKYSPSVNNRVVYRGLPKGKHRVTVFLVKNDHSNYKNAGAHKTITFTVK